LWDFRSKETIVEALDMIVEENNVPFIVYMGDYPQKLNEIEETWRA
jgi:hypothetical protein